MVNLVEFKVTRTLFDDVKNDPEFRIGFEAEFHVRNASDLLMDREGYLPNSFETFNNAGTNNPEAASFNQNDWNSYLDRDEDEWNQQPDEWSDNEYEELHYHHDTALLRLAPLFAAFMGLPPDSISTENSGYTKWRLMLDSSLYKSPRLLNDADHDLGVELVSPVMPLKDGLAWMAKVFEMIESFRHGEIALYTTAMCGFHVNLSHVRMGINNFDVAKLAILSGDQHYLSDFDRVKNNYAAPLMQAVYDQLVTAKEHPETMEPESPKTAAALGLLRLRNWTPQRVMQDLGALIPMSHYYSVDFTRMDSMNPYIEIRAAGSAQYERRFDDIAQLAIRFGALIKIACDPYAYREEYLRKVYQLVTGVMSQQSPAAQQAPQEAASPFPRLRVYLAPIMSTATRRSFDLLETYWRKQTLSIQNGSYLVLAIIRSAFDLRQQDTARVRQGLSALIRGVLKIEPLDLLKSLKNTGLLGNYGVLRPGDKALTITTALTNYLKALNQPLANPARSATLAGSAGIQGQV